MPIYEYKCSACNHPLEVMQKMSDQPLTDCPACHKPSLVKLISAAGFQLKGTGWYATDFRNKPKEKSQNTDTPATEKTESKGNKEPSSSSSSTTGGETS